MTLPDLTALLIGFPEEAAPRLLGCSLVSLLGGERVVAQIVEVEAYKGSDDAASHAYRGRNPRNGSMFEAPGTLYIYRSYGVHWCANVACGPEGTGWGVLFRAARLVEGVAVARRRRGREDGLSDGPGKLTQALGISGEHDGIPLLDAGSEIRLLPGEPPGLVMATPRVGISRAKDRPWRFVVAESASAPVVAPSRR